MTDNVRARLLKVVVQPVFVIDDGDQLDEVTGAPVSVTGREWRDFAQTSFSEEDLAQIVRQWEEAK